MGFLMVSKPTPEDTQRAALLLREWQHRFGICFSDAGEGGLTVPLALALGEARAEERARCVAAVKGECLGRNPGSDYGEGYEEAIGDAVKAVESLK
jgi:hypothetical protein